MGRTWACGGRRAVGRPYMADGPLAAAYGPRVRPPVGVWAVLGPCGAVWAVLGPCGPLRATWAAYGPLRAAHGPPWATWATFRARGRVGPCGVGRWPVWAAGRPCGTFRAMGRVGVWPLAAGGRWPLAAGVGRWPVGRGAARFAPWPVWAVWRPLAVARVAAGVGRWRRPLAVAVASQTDENVSYPRQVVSEP